MAIGLPTLATTMLHIPFVIAAGFAATRENRSAHGLQRRVSWVCLTASAQRFDQRRSEDLTVLVRAAFMSFTDPNLWRIVELCPA